MLTQKEATDAARYVREVHDADRRHLETLRSYLRGKGRAPYVPEKTAGELRDLARTSRKNIMRLVVGSLADHLVVAGYRPAAQTDNARPWQLWQANRLDGRQELVHRASLAYGAAYALVLPGRISVDGEQRDAAIITPRSPRRVCALYNDPESDLWPIIAAEQFEIQGMTGRSKMLRLYDEHHRWTFSLADDPHDKTVMQFREVEEHAVGVCPVVRFLNHIDDDRLGESEIEPLISQQDAINSLAFDLRVLEKYGAFPQKWIAGWTPDDRQEAAEASARQILTFDDPETKLGVFQAASLSGYLESQQAEMEHAAMLAQIPPQQVTGRLINVSAEALALTVAGQQRKIRTKRLLLGEAWEQTLRLASQIAGDAESAADESAQVVWADTEERSFAAVVDGLVKLAQAGVPIEALLDQVPGWTQQDVDRARSMIAARPEVTTLLQQLAAGDTSPGTPPGG